MTGEFPEAVWQGNSTVGFRLSREDQLAFLDGTMPKEKALHLQCDENVDLWPEGTWPDGLGLPIIISHLDGDHFDYVELSMWDPDFAESAWVYGSGAPGIRDDLVERLMRRA